jgi:hypothetical protein
LHTVASSPSRQDLHPTSELTALPIAKIQNKEDLILRELGRPYLTTVFICLLAPKVSLLQAFFCNLA